LLTHLGVGRLAKEPDAIAFQFESDHPLHFLKLNIETILRYEYECSKARKVRTVVESSHRCLGRRVRLRLVGRRVRTERVFHMATKMRA